VPFTIPPSNKVALQAGFIPDIDNTYDALSQIAGVNVCNSAYAGGADNTGTGACDSAITTAVAALPASGGAVLFLPGTYKITSGVTITSPGVYLHALVPGTVTINYTGSGDCIRMYSTTLTTPNGVYGGGVTGGIIIDGTSASAGACGIHAGDIFRMRWDCTVRDFQGTGSKGFWFDNQYHWAEQMYGQIFAEACTTHVQFDNSANPNGSATGSFDRALLDINIDAKGKGNLVILANGASIHDGRVTIVGNTDYGTSLFYVLTLTGPPALSFTATNASPCVFTASGWYWGNGTPVILAGGSLPAGFTAGTTYFVVNVNIGAGTFQLAATSGGAAINSTSTGSGTVQSISYSRIVNSVLNIGVECGGTSGTQPGTINFANSAILSNCIQQCTGIIDFSAASAFAANATNWTSNFLYDGPAYGDGNLKASPSLGRGTYAVGAIANGGTINTRFNASATVVPTGNVTGIVMSRDFTSNVRDITVINQSAFTVTFDVAATSFVADGAADIIQPLSAVRYTWNPNTSLWYRAGSPALPATPDLSLLLAPSGATAETFPRSFATVTSAALVSGQVYVSAVPLPASLAVGNLAIGISSTGFTGVTHGWLALLDSGLVVRAVTADQTSSFGSAFNQLKLATGAYTTTSGGLYYLAVCVTATGMGTICESGTLASAVSGAAPVVAGLSSSGQTTPPSTGTTMGALTANGAWRFYGYTS
jgi:hypothetical protein